MQNTNSLKTSNIDSSAGAALCDHPGCSASANHRAPKARNRLNDYYWFCLDHIREYNRSWNYCAGMTNTQVESEIRNDTVWRRPSWPLGSQDGKFSGNARFHDDLGVFEAAASMNTRRKQEKRTKRPKQNAEVRHALRIMNFDSPVTLTELKSRYKELVKRLHPDANGGNRAAEEKLKDINQAYATLKKFLVA
tara:strand:+ start:595 stop:1173 length:579 start_codon:yes stop_codon:yes gene_type:complete